MSSNKQVVLSFIDWYRPGYKAGGTITSFGNFVDHMDTVVDFKIITRDVDYLTPTPYENIDSDTWIKNGVHQCFYISNKSLGISFIKNLISNTPHNYIYINGVFSFYFSILPVVLSKGKNCILNPHGMLSDQAFSVKSLKKTIFLKLINFLKLYRNVTFHVSNEAEALAVRKHVKSYNSIIIANQFPRKVSSELLNSKGKNNVVRFVNVARISVEKGTLTMLNALQHVKQSLQLDIYGPVYDSAYWTTCEHVITTLPSHISVNYKGVLHSDDVLKTLSFYDYFVLLSEGENFGHAILEALSVGLPVLISDQTPWHNLIQKHIGWDIDVKDEEAIIRAFQRAVLMENADYQEWAKAAFIFAKRFIEDPEVLEQNKALFLGI